MHNLSEGLHNNKNKFEIEERVQTSGNKQELNYSLYNGKSKYSEHNKPY
jgi:hypothetical protein